MVKVIYIYLRPVFINYTYFMIDPIKQEGFLNKTLYAANDELHVWDNNAIWC